MLTILENGTIVNGQFLITSNKALNNLKTDDLAMHINFEIADFINKSFEEEVTLSIINNYNIYTNL